MDNILLDEIPKLDTRPNVDIALFQAKHIRQLQQYIAPSKQIKRLYLTLEPTQTIGNVRNVFNELEGLITGGYGSLLVPSGEPLPVFDEVEVFGFIVVNVGSTVGYLYNANSGKNFDNGIGHHTVGFNGGTDSFPNLMKPIRAGMTITEMGGVSQPLELFSIHAESTTLDITIYYTV